MISSLASPAEIRIPDYSLFLNREGLFREGLLKLLAITDSDIRILTLLQARDAVDKGLHSRGAFSAVLPLAALFYGGILRLDIEDPTRRGQDIFTLSKGHAVAAMASIYAELGYFGPEMLKHSRSHASLLNGHPGPLLPGVHIATGPMGQGIGVAQGFAIAGRTSPRFDSYCMVRTVSCRRDRAGRLPCMRASTTWTICVSWSTATTASLTSTTAHFVPCLRWTRCSGRSAGTRITSIRPPTAEYWLRCKAFAMACATDGRRPSSAIRRRASAHSPTS